jgi:hypothetical protein
VDRESEGRSVRLLIVDMTRHLRRWLNDKALSEQFGDTYEGRIADVVEQTIRNRFTAEKQLEPVIRFEDGWCLIPNISQRRALVAMWGSETNDWVGRRLQVYRHRKERTDEATGRLRVTYEKRVRLPISELERAI